ncbi:nucleotide exchange factor GrpE [Natronospira bacteriovora]|uniref:Protein GrpE n=1 Tax=Natronospira bacteriovora TaxID=3069753 RepID=A0ABU0W6M5_9GAMM|nr:nucleotide exchange factor GrpE [Natronospira sp. AB-CW4]MDQ2069115.1 nucleotide exchange factor GrpE [Natronospira sp. AB-CW4]
MSQEQPKAPEELEGAEQAEAEQNPESDAEAVAESPEARIEQLQAELEEARSERLRAMAELENVRKRARRDVENAQKFSVEKLAGELLEVKDSLEMGLQAVGGENPSLDQLREGKEMTLRQLAGVMERAGIAEINPEGERFNPEFHEAMTLQESSDHDPDTVMFVIQKGYLLKGRLLRPARVVVARAPDGGADDADSGDDA